MNQQEKLLNQLLEDDRFRRWVLNGEHEQHWKKWLKEHPGQEEIMEDAKAIVRGLPVRTIDVPSPDIERSFQDLVNQTAYSGYKTRELIVRWLPYVAAAVLALLITVLLWNSTEKQERQVNLFVATAIGEQKDIVLPDSSIVVLNGNSSLKYNEDHQSRNVTLEGEAHFQVRRIEGQNGRKPFIVSTDELNISVLGTTFSVGADSIWTTVVLEEGKVRLEGVNMDRHTSRLLTMKPDEKVVFNRLESTFSVEHINAEEFNSWTHNELSLVNRSASEVARWIKRNYSISIDIPDQLEQSSLTGTIDLEDPQMAVRVFALALGLEPVKEGDLKWRFKKPKINK